MVKRGEKGVPRSAETRAKIGVGSRATRIAELQPCPEGCEGLFNRGNLTAHSKKYHTFVCKIPDCVHTVHEGLGLCGAHYRLHVMCTKVGTTVAEYYRVYLEQEGKCKLCSREGALQGTGVSRVGMLVIDHCHSSGGFRGLLCHRCNVGLGQFQDNIAVLENAIAYLKGEK